MALGGTLIQHIPDASPTRSQHEQPNPRHEPGHAVAVRAGHAAAPHRRRGRDAGELARIIRRCASPGRSPWSNAIAPDGVIEGVEDARYRFCLGVQWHPEFLIDPGDRRIFDALIAACRA